MRHFVLHSMVRLTVGVVIDCGMLVPDAVYTDTVLKDTEVHADVRPEAKSGLISNVMSKTGDVVINALGMIGLRYHSGDNTPESGLDYSGSIRYAFGDTFGFLLPHRAVEMSRVGTSVDTAELCPDDLVFFNTMHHMFSYVGIYIGDNKFACASSTGSKIHVDDMTASCWVIRYDGARHIGGSSGTAIKDGADSFIEQLRRVNPSAAGKPLVMYGGRVAVIGYHAIKSCHRLT